jgi:hypothetical protein
MHLQISMAPKMHWQGRDDLREAAVGRDIFEQLQADAGQARRRFWLDALGFEVLSLQRGQLHVPPTFTRCSE